MEIRIPRWLLLVPIALVLLAALVLAARVALARGENPDVAVAKRAAVQIQTLRRDETYDALSPELADYFRKSAQRAPESERDRRVEVLGAALVWQGEEKGERFSEVAVTVKIYSDRNPTAPPLISRAIYRVQGGKVTIVFPVRP